MALIDELLYGRNDVAPPLRRTVNPFPRNDQGALTNPDYVQSEGERIRNSLAAGTYGEQPLQAATAQAGGTPPITVVGTREIEPPRSFWDMNMSQGEILRDTRLENLRSLAAQRRAEIEQIPLKNDLLQAQIDATGAHQRFLENQDAATLGHTAGFLDYLSHPNSPAMGTPEFANYFLSGLRKYPRFAGTPGGRELLQEVAKNHDAHQTIADLTGQIPGGFEIASGEIGGGKQSHINVRPTGTGTVEELKRSYGITPGQIKTPINLVVGDFDPTTKQFVGSNTGKFVRFGNGKGDTITMPTADYERYGGGYSDATAKARQGAVKAAPKADLTALAREALNDPNSSEGDKIQARKILGP